MKKTVVFLSLFIAGFAYAQSPPPLSNISIEMEAGIELPLGNSIRAEIFTNKPAALIKTLSKLGGVKLIESKEKSVTLHIPQRYAFNDKSNKSDTQDTFVIDYKEESVKEFISDFSEQHSVQQDESPRLSELESFVSKYINDPTYIHGFKLASVVASERSGDCTEYAVLLTALARAFELPAKVVLGSVVVEQHGDINAYGHAWVEVFKNDEWHILDAALYGDIGIKRFYLPSDHLNNEGPGYAMSLVSAISLLPQKIHLKMIR